MSARSRSATSTRSSTKAESRPGTARAPSHRANGKRPPARAGDKTAVTPQRIMQFAWGYAIPLIIEAALEHKVFETLDTGPRTAADLARLTGASARGLRAICDALVSVDLLARDGGPREARYSLTPESRAFLVPGRESFQGGIFRHITSQLLPKWMKISQVVRAGGPDGYVNDETTGAQFFQQFVEDIFPMSHGAARVLGESLGLARATGERRVLDIAAGSGVWGIGLAEQSPKVRVTAVDWAGVLPVTRRVAARFGLADRFRFIEGDLRTVDFGGGYDIATLGHILHSEGPVHSRRLLAKVAAALKSGGTIAIAEFLADDNRNGPPQSMIFAVNMLVNTDEGDTFSLAEIRQWLQESGFKNIRTLDAPGPSPLILAEKK